MKWLGRSVLPVLVVSVSLLVSTGRAAPIGFAGGESKLSRVTANSLALGNLRLQTSKSLLVVPAGQPLLGRAWVLADTDDDTTSYQRIVYRKPLSKTMGVAFAVFPGFFVHGTGHFYAKDTKMGLILLGIEVASVTAITLEGLSRFDSANRQNDALVAVGVVGFFGSWAADILLVSKAVDRYNWHLETRINTGNRTALMAVCLSF